MNGVLSKAWRFVRLAWRSLRSRIRSHQVDSPKTGVQTQPGEQENSAAARKPTEKKKAAYGGGLVPENDSGREPHVDQQDTPAEQEQASQMSVENLATEKPVQQEPGKQEQSLHKPASRRDVPGERENSAAARKPIEKKKAAYGGGLVPENNNGQEPHVDQQDTPAEQEQASQTSVENLATEKPVQQEPGKQEQSKQSGLVETKPEGLATAVDKEQSTELEARKPSTDNQQRPKPSKRGGMRGRAAPKKMPTPNNTGRSRAPARVPRARIVCRQSAGTWQLVVVPKPGVVVRSSTEGPVAQSTGEFTPGKFRNVVLIEDTSDGQMEQIPLFAGKPMVFRLDRSQKEGKKVGHVRKTGLFIVIAPAELPRLDDTPVVKPEPCVDQDFRAHYFVGGAGDRGFDGHSVSSSVIELDGERVFDESEQGDLFVRQPPVLRAPGMMWARVGEEGTQRWAETFRLDERRSLEEVLDGRQGWFFVRVYREGASVEADSMQFRYLADLREIRVAGKSYATNTVLVPTTQGHATADVEIVCADGSEVLMAEATDGTRQFDISDRTVACPPDPEVKQVRCRLEGPSGGVNIVVGLPRVWWRLATPGEPQEPWRDTAQTVTRKQFRELAAAGSQTQVKLPKCIRNMKAGFENESSMSYRAHRPGPQNRCDVPLKHYLDHSQIDKRLFQDAVLRVHNEGSEVNLIRVAADPPPRIVDFSAGPGRVSAGDVVTVRWKVEDCEGVVISLAPGAGQVDAEGSREIRVERATVITLTLSAPGMENVVEERGIEVEGLQPDIAGPLVAYAKAAGCWRRAKGFSLGELAAVPGAERLPVRTDRRRRSVHERNAASLERWLNEQH